MSRCQTQHPLSQLALVRVEIAQAIDSDQHWCVFWTEYLLYSSKATILLHTSPLSQQAYPDRHRQGPSHCPRPVLKDMYPGPMVVFGVLIYLILGGARWYCTSSPLPKELLLVLHPPSSPNAPNQRQRMHTLLFSDFEACSDFHQGT